MSNILSLVCNLLFRVLYKIKSRFIISTKGLSSALDDPLTPISIKHGSKSPMVQQDSGVVNRLKSFNASFNQQYAAMSARALRPHDSTCKDPMMCNKNVCFERVPDKIVSRIMIVDKNTKMVQQDSADIADLKSFNDSFDQQYAAMSDRALRPHDGPCKDPLICKQKVCFKRVPDKIVSKIMIVENRSKKWAKWAKMVQPDLAAINRLKPFNDSFDQQYAAMSNRALHPHDSSCQDSLMCKKNVCFKRVPDEIASKIMIVDKDTKMVLSIVSMGISKYNDQQVGIPILKSKKRRMKVRYNK